MIYEDLTGVVDALMQPNCHGIPSTGLSRDEAVARVRALAEKLGRVVVEDGGRIYARPPSTVEANQGEQ